MFKSGYHGFWQLKNDCFMLKFFSFTFEGMAEKKPEGD